MTGDPLLAASSLGKVYGTPVLQDVDLALRAGEVHALVGENGAGKSTLSKILSGIVTPDSGRMQLRGMPYAPRRKADAEARGVGIVLQELNVIGTLTVAEQVQFGRLPSRAGFVDRRALHEGARTILERVGLGQLDPRRLVSSLGTGERQLVAVAGELARARDLLILDEPTAALSERDADLLLAQIACLRAAGSAIVYISHRLEEVLRLADRIAVLRDGRVVATRARGETTVPELVALMVGRDVAPSAPRARSAPTPASGPAFTSAPTLAPASASSASVSAPARVLLRVTGLRRLPAVRDVSFDLRRGEILGLAGLMGAGRTEAVRALCGADRAEAGEVRLDGRSSSRPFANPREAVAHGLALVTENRKDEGLLLPLGIRQNVTIANLGRVASRGFVRRDAEAGVARAWIERLAIAGARSVEQPVSRLSGGNQQKVVLARWLDRQPRILVCDEPTRGIDVGARAEIHRLLVDFARDPRDGGCAVLVVSSQLEELTALCDRIVVLSLGRVAGTFERAVRGAPAPGPPVSASAPASDWDQEAILAAALHHHARADDRAAGAAPA